MNYPAHRQARRRTPRCLDGRSSQLQSPRRVPCDLRVVVAQRRSRHPAQAPGGSLLSSACQHERRPGCRGLRLPELLRRSWACRLLLLGGRLPPCVSVVRLDKRRLPVKPHEAVRRREQESSSYVLATLRSAASSPLGARLRVAATRAPAGNTRRRSPSRSNARVRWRCCPASALPRSRRRDPARATSSRSLKRPGDANGRSR